MKKYIVYALSILIITVLFTTCSRFLEEKSDLKLTTPETLEDNQALLDRISDVLTDFALSGMASSDEYYLSDADYNALSYEEDKRLYTWQPDRVSTSQSAGNDWQYCYKAIFIANSVLNNIETYQIPASDNVRGQALAIRAIRYFDAAQIWCMAYDASTADQTLGLPLRLDPDMNIPSQRASLKQTYVQIIKDLKDAVLLLPVQQVALSRPSKVAALASLARVYLMMGEYENALSYSLQALSFKNELIDFNTLNNNDTYPIKEMNKEMLLIAYMRSSGPVRGATAKVPAEIYAGYNENDLRKKLFFRLNADQSIAFRGNYSGNIGGKLTSVAVDELYLIVAECYARVNKRDQAMNYLNSLLVTRWKSGTFVPETASSAQDALIKIKEERKKELMFRGVRWMDIKRYNRDGSNITLTKTVVGQNYTLPANDLRYAIAIPEQVIQISGMVQNPRK